MLQALDSKTSDIPPLPPAAAQLPACESDHIVSDWRADDVRALATIDAWHTKVPDGYIVKENIGPQGQDVSCLVEAPLAPSDGPAHVLTLVKRVGPLVCGIGGQNMTALVAVEFDFVLGPGTALALRQPTRRVSVVWPPEGTCTEATPCAVMFSFHGCGGERPYEKYDAACLPDLGTVLVFPILLTGEMWTDPDNAALDTFVLPLLTQLRQEHVGILDERRIGVAGSSMGSGLALQAALRHPDIFSFSLVIGLTDGHVCSFASFDSTIFDGLPDASALGDAWKLRVLAIVLGEAEDVVPMRSPWRLNSTLDLLSGSGAMSRSAVQVRLLKSLNHLDMIKATWFNWAGLYEFLWKGKWGQ